MSEKRRWINVGIRLPLLAGAGLKELQFNSSAVITAMSNLMPEIPKIWIGSLAGGDTKKSWESSLTKHLAEGLKPVPLAQDLYLRYYNSVCAELLWPLFHYGTNLHLGSLDRWQDYRLVNQKFAEVILDTAKPDDLVWIHDYHLLLLPGMLRQRRSDLRVGFFLHIPFPSSEVFRQLPMRKEILESLIQADLIGFHDYSYLRHFGSAVYHVLGIRSSLLAIEHNQHTAQLGVFPVSIDSNAIRRTAHSSRVQKFIDNHKGIGGRRHVILGVDRLDHTKGVELKIAAFRRLLAQHPELIGQVQLIQVAAPSRTESPDHLELKAHIDQQVGALNSEFGLLDWVPVQCLLGIPEFDELVGLYRLADVFAVTSKRDGMNLHCLEFAAAQEDDDPGVLVMSEFAGSSAILNEALLVNPWDVGQTATALYQALTMDADERRRRHAATLSYLKNYTSADWADAFMQRLTRQALVGEQNVKTELLDAARLKEELDFEQDERLVLFLDYDGTLVPIRTRPEHAILPQRTRRILKKLKENPKVDVIIISGRDPAFLDGQLGTLECGLVADHGARYRAGDAPKWKSRLSGSPRLWYGAALRIMQDYSKRTPGSFIERKSFAVAWHYRESPEDFAEYQARNLSEDLSNALSALPVTVLNGKKVVEVRAAEANKGAFVSWYLRTVVKKESVNVICVGDDTTDEDMFVALPSNALSVRVGSPATRARFYLAQQKEVPTLLQAVLEMLKAADDPPSG